MYRKNCDKCNQPSFSSSEFGQWLCPICGNDLTRQPFYNPITFEQVFVGNVKNPRKVKNNKE